MSSIEQYDSIYKSNILKIKSGSIQIDNYLNGNILDSRKGVSLIIPIKTIHDSYFNLKEKINEIDKDQYIYPFDDLHVTIFDFIQGTKNYKADIDTEKICIEISNNVLNTINTFWIEYKGITCSSSAGLIQGFDDNQLVNIREKIRKNMELFNLKNDERYKSESSHITFLRFMKKIKDTRKFVNFINNNRITNIGKEKVKDIELVEHDWYNKKESKRVINKYQLTTGST